MKKFDLDNQPKIDSGFKIPKDYFERFEDRLMANLPEKEVKTISLWQRKSVWISGIAAVFTLGLGTWLYYNHQRNETFASSQEYLAYESNITTEEIVNHLSDEDITNFEKELNLYGPEAETYVNEYLD